MKTDHINCPIRPRVTLENPDEPLEMIGFTIARCDLFKTGHGVSNDHNGDFVIPQEWLIGS